MIESNVYMCFNAFSNSKGMTRHEWKCAMADDIS